MFVLSPTAVVLPKAEKLLKVSIQPYISSILDALMEPTSRGFSEVRNLFFKELVDMSKNTINEGTKETIAQVRKWRTRFRLSPSCLVLHASSVLKSRTFNSPVWFVKEMK